MIRKHMEAEGHLRSVLIHSAVITDYSWIHLDDLSIYWHGFVQDIGTLLLSDGFLLGHSLFLFLASFINILFASAIMIEL